MSEANKRVARHLVEEMDRGNFSVFDEICAPQYKCHFAGAPSAQSRDEHREAAQGFYFAFPDMRHEIHDVIAEGNMVVLRATPGGTHRAEFLGVPATGKRVAFDVVAFFRIDNGKISEEWVVADLMGLQQQLIAKT